MPLQDIKYPQNKVNTILMGKETSKIIKVFLNPLISKGCLKAIAYAPKVKSLGNSKNPGDCKRAVCPVKDATSI